MAWVADNSPSSPSIAAKAVEDGVVFSFAPSPGSFLEIRAKEVESSSEVTLVQVYRRLTVKPTSSQVENLIRFAAQSLTDSLTSDIADLISELQHDLNNAGDEDQPEQETASQERSVPVIELEEDEVDLDLLERRARPWEPRLPSQKEILDLFEVTKLSSPTPSSSTGSSFDTDLVHEESTETVSQANLNSAHTDAVETLEAPRENSELGQEGDVIFTWDQGEYKASVGERGLSEWAKKFTNRGTGITFRTITDGIELEFSIISNFTLQYMIISELQEVHIIAKNVGISNDDHAMSLVRKAIENLHKSLKTYFENISMASGYDEDSSLDSVNEEDRLQESIQATSRANTELRASQPSAKMKSSRYRDPSISQAADALRLNLEKFEDMGMEDQAIKQLNDMVDTSRKQGFLATIKSLESHKTNDSMETGADLTSLFSEGVSKSRLSWEQMLQRKYEIEEDFSKSPAQFPMDFSASGLEKGIDIFEGPSTDLGSAPVSSLDGQRSKIAGDTMPEDVAAYPMDLRRMQLLLNELKNSPMEMHGTILGSFKDLLLAENFLYIMKQLNSTQNDAVTRQLCGKIVESAKQLTAELGALAKTESVRHLETIHDLSQVAVNYQHDEIRFLNELDRIKPRIDTDFLGYLRFAIKEETRSIKLSGSDPDRYPSKWLQVLQVIYQGALAEFESRFDRLLEPLILTLRFENSDLRRVLLERFVNITPILDLYYMRTLALNMASHVMNSPDAAFSDEKLKDRMPQFLNDIELVLSEERIETKIAELKEELRSQGKELFARHRNPVVQQEYNLEANESLGQSGSSTVGQSILEKFRQRN